MICKFFAVRAQPMSVDIGILLTRLVMGIAFVLHGFGKIQNPFHWMGVEAAVPGFLQGLAALAEFGGGIALILGLFMRLGVLGIACTMLVAVGLHAIVLGDPFVNLTGGSSFEPAAVYLVMAVLLLILGSGRFSLDRKIFG